MMKAKTFFFGLLAAGPFVGQLLSADASKLVSLTDKLSLKNGPLARRMAAEALGKQGDAAAAAAPALLKTLADDPDSGVRLNAAWALGKIKNPTDEMIAGLTAALGDAEWQVRHNATLSLTWIGQPAVPPLKAVVSGENLAKRAHALRALITIDPALGGELMPNLLELMRNEHPGMKQYAAETAGKCGEVAKGAVPELVGLLDDKTPEVRKEALAALGLIGTPSAASVPKIVELLKTDAQRANRIAAVLALSQVAKADPVGIDALVSAFDDKDSRVRSAAASAVGQVGEVAIPALGKALKAQDSRTRELTAMALSIIGPPAKSTVGALVICLDDDDAAVRTMVADALGRIGVNSDQVRGALEKARGKEAANTPLRSHYDQALAALSGTEKSAP